jgi:hypothetical protein
MRAAENRALADDMKEPQPIAMMLRIANEYDRLAEWAEKNSISWWDKKRSASNADEAPRIARISPSSPGLLRKPDAM